MNPSQIGYISVSELLTHTVVVFAGKFAKAQLLATMKNSCLPKLICELNAMPQKDKLTDSEKALLSLIRSVSSKLLDLFTTVLIKT